MTMPVVPRIERPPTMPKRPFSVFWASFSPPGTEISTTISPGCLKVSAASRIASRIMARGTGLIAGSPGGMGKPARVTMPTPGPARNVTPLPASPRETVAMMSAPCVTSGSSPASLMMPARAHPSPSSWVARAKLGRVPFGSVASTGSGNSPVNNASTAARVAAAAHVPVVQPRRRIVWLLAAGSE